MSYESSLKESDFSLLNGSAPEKLFITNCSLIYHLFLTTCSNLQLDHVLSTISTVASTHSATKNYTITATNSTQMSRCDFDEKQKKYLQSTPKFLVTTETLFLLILLVAVTTTALWFSRMHIVFGFYLCRSLFNRDCKKNMTLVFFLFSILVGIQLF